jgi:hypothetical protein
LNQEHDERDSQQDVNESTQGVRADKPQHPQNEQYNGNGPQHFVSPLSMTWWRENVSACAAPCPATSRLRPAGG